jgi:hypothetical protein
MFEQFKEIIEKTLTPKFQSKEVSAGRYTLVTFVTKYGDGSVGFEYQQIGEFNESKPVD